MVVTGEMLAYIDRSYSIMHSDRVHKKGVPVFTYGTDKEYVDACLAARQTALVQGHRVGAAMQLISENLQYFYDHLAFDGVLFRSRNIPVVYLDNSLVNERGLTLVCELMMVAELERKERELDDRPATLERTGASQLRVAGWIAVVSLFIGIVVQAAKLRVERGH
jgi:hypothetical protein